MPLVWKLVCFVSMILGWLISLAASIFLIVVASEGRGRDAEVVPFLMPIAALPAAFGIGLPFLILTWIAWSAIQDGKPRFSPPLATLLLLVPCVNVIWAFLAYWGWTQDFNEYARQKNLNVTRAPEGLALAMCISILVSWIPCLDFVSLVLRMIYINGVINSLDSLNQAKAGTAGKFPAAGSVPSPPSDRF